jgi:hypothetical protein
MLMVRGALLLLVLLAMVQGAKAARRQKRPKIETYVTRD